MVIEPDYLSLAQWAEHKNEKIWFCNIFVLVFPPLGKTNLKVSPFSRKVCHLAQEHTASRSVTVGLYASSLLGLVISNVH